MIGTSKTISMKMKAEMKSCLTLTRMTPPMKSKNQSMILIIPFHPCMSLPWCNLVSNWTIPWGNLIHLLFQLMIQSIWIKPKRLMLLINLKLKKLIQAMLRLGVSKWKIKKMGGFQALHSKCQMEMHMMKVFPKWWMISKCSLMYFKKRHSMVSSTYWLTWIPNKDQFFW